MLLSTPGIEFVQLYKLSRICEPMTCRVAMFASDLASLSAGPPPEHINTPSLSSSSTDAAVKLAAPAQFRSSFSWKVSVAWRVFLPWGL